MKARHLFLATAALLAVYGLWLGLAAWRAYRPPVTSETTSSMGVGSNMPGGRSEPGQRLRPPDPNRRFRDLTPEQRVQQARQPHGVGG